MISKKKILLILGFLGIAIGGYAITKYLTRNVYKSRGWTVTHINYDTPPSLEPLED